MSQEKNNTWKAIGVVGGFLAALFTAVLIKSNHDSRQNKPLSFDQYLKSASLEQLEADRENYRRKNASDPDWYWVLKRYDDEIRERKWGNVDNSGQSLPHREHGWYLPNDD